MVDKEDVQLVKAEIIDAPSLAEEAIPTQQIIEALSMPYHDVFYVNADTNRFTPIRTSDVTIQILGTKLVKSNFEQAATLYVENFVDEFDRKIFAGVISCEKLKQFFADKDTYSFFFRSILTGESHFIQCQIISLDDRKQGFVMAFRNMDEERKRELEWQKEFQDRKDMVTSMSKLFDNAIYVDIKKNTYYEIRTLPNVKGIIHATYDAIEQIDNVCRCTVMPESQAVMRKFLDVRTMAQRLKGKNVLTQQYLGRAMGWSEAYLIVGSRDEEGNIVNMFYATRCIHEEKMKELEREEKERQQKVLLEEALRSAEAANEAKSSFLSNVSHDIRTPLNGIIGMTAIALSQINDSAKVEDCLKKIDTASQHLLSLINEVLDMSKIESGNMSLAYEPFNLMDVLNDSVSMMKTGMEEHNHQFVMNVDKGIETKVIGDAMRLKQVCVNLLSNMVKYTKDGGQLRLDVRPSKTRKYIKASAMGYELVFQDNGIGISEEMLKIIFNPFVRDDEQRNSKIQGTGLGLSIARNIIRKMGGDIKVASELDKGSTFTVTFFLKKQEQAAFDDSDKAVIPELPKRYTVDDLKKLHLKGKRVLLVEDNELNAEIAHTVLEATGLTVDYAEDGEKAVNMVARGGHGRYDMIFMDIMMPKINGYEATRMIRTMPGLGQEYSKGLPIIAMTAKAFDEDVESAKAAGMNDHLAKPLDIGRLAETLLKWLG